ncbi:hypothetical protein VPHD69_0091 [Vibrio phage D69]
MLTREVAVVEYVQVDMTLEDFKDFVKEIKLFPFVDKGYSWQRQTEDELTLFRSSGPHHVCGFLDVPASIIPPKPEGEYWDEHAKKHIETIYNYLSEKGEVISYA